MGDVAISAPLVRAYASANSDSNFYMVSQPRFEAMFNFNPKTGKSKIAPKPNNLFYIPLNTKHGAKDYSGGIIHLIKFALRVKKEYGITHFADIHDVLRTKVIRIILRILGVRVATINKHRRERNKLCRKNNKHLKQIIKSQRCMEEVFISLGMKDLHFSDTTNTTSNINVNNSLSDTNITNTGISIDTNIGTNSNIKVNTNSKTNTGIDTNIKFDTNDEPIKIGIAPFAGHRGKEWSADKMEEVVKYFSNNNVKIFLYGGGKRELDIMSPWAQKYPNVELFAGKHTLEEELQSMENLDLMLSMDSANMHLASLVGTPVVCIWGATHKFAGYNGWGQSEDNSVEVALECRPCSIFGAKPCIRKDYACLENITPQMVIEKICNTLSRLLERKQILSNN